MTGIRQMASLAKKMVAVAKDRALRVAGMDIKAAYVAGAPTAQNALDIFEGEWASQLPRPFDHLAAGDSRLFEDPRITWLSEVLGGVDGMSVMECGPLEGGHTYMMEKMGAASIVAVEASTRAFLRCLVVKELLRTTRSRFVLGDFVSHLELGRSYDLILACGVLYHLVDPIHAIALMAKATDKLYIWTHYYDEQAIKSQLGLALRFSSSARAEHEGFQYTLHRQNYQSRLGNPSFVGGAEQFSHWLEKEHLLGALRRFGFDKITVQFDERGGAAGPNISLLAERTGQPPRARPTDRD